MKSIRKIKRYLVLILVFFEIGYFFSCGKSTNDDGWSPLSPEDSPIPSLSNSGSGSGGTSNPSTLSGHLMVRKRESSEDGVSTAWIGPAGGVLQHAAHRIEVPAGALDQTVQLTFSMPVSDTLMFELGPDGIQFNIPIKVIFNWDHAFTNGLDEKVFSVVFWNTNSLAWDSVSTAVDTELDEAAGSTNHFTRYSIRK